MLKAHYIKAGSLFIILAITLTGCNSSGGARGSVWDTYDYRHPVPGGSKVPISRATSYDQYQTDSESDYTAPKNFGNCVASDLANFTCE